MNNTVRRFQKMYYVYRFLDKNKSVIYVGKTKQSLETRFRGHQHLPAECYAMTYQIEYIKCSTESDMSIKEIYYINLYQNNPMFFNLLDLTEAPKSVRFNDKWVLYTGSLPPQFSNSVNYTQGYTSKKEAHFNLDGSVSKKVTNKKVGVSSYVESLSNDEVDLMANYLVSRIKNAENRNQEQIWLRNLVMFILGINLPLKTPDFLKLKYKDVFDVTDCPKSITMQLARLHRDEEVCVPLRNIVKTALLVYREKFDLCYAENAEDYLFMSRKHQAISSASWWRILSEAAVDLNLSKNIGAESLRKTYCLNIYQLADDKINALVFIEKLSATSMFSNVIEYLNLSDGNVDFEYYFGEHFALCRVDIGRELAFLN